MVKRDEYVRDFINSGELYYDEYVKHHSSSSTLDYYITSYGRVLSITKDNGTIRWLTLTPCTSNSYHNQFRTSNGSYTVHRAVGKAFLPDFIEELQVCHKDEEAPLTYRHSSAYLWMGTAKENEQDKHSKGRNYRGNQFVCCESAIMRLHTIDGLTIDVPWDERHQWLEERGMTYAGLLNLRRPKRQHPYKGITHYQVIN